MKPSLMVALAMSAALFIGGAVICLGQSRIESSSKVRGNNVRQSRKRKLRLGLVGYLLLPKGYKVYRTGKTVDAQGGYILSPDNSLKINWSAGMVQSPFADGEDKFLWIKREEIGNGGLSYGLKRTDEGEIIAATVGWVNFTMPVKSENNISKFLGIVRGYRMGQCNNDCESPLPAPQFNNSFNRSGNSLDVIVNLGAARQSFPPG